ncbi:MAG: hypothetical protein ABIG35_10250 [Pseudomonadota bacterium]
MTNTETLHAIDALYLGNFRQTLFHKILHAQLELREYLRVGRESCGILEKIS